MRQVFCTSGEKDSFSHCVIPGRVFSGRESDSIFTGKFLRAKSMIASFSSGACVHVEYTKVPPALRHFSA